MPNWYTVVAPHEDIREGHFSEAVFAAKLGDVVSGDAPPDYKDPYAFVRKTYLTKGLENMLRSVHARLSAGEGPGVVQLKTPFGGGKTHALILVYHYLTSGDRVEELLPEGVGLVDTNVAALVGSDANPSEGFRDGEVVRRTLWGEIAYQLGGRHAYAQVANNDQNRISPGRKDLKAMLEPLQPFVILLDEVLEYVVRAQGIGTDVEPADVQVGGTTLGAQTLSFCQELTEAVSGLANGLMLVTLPSSEQEDFGDAKQGNLAKLEKIFGRLESVYVPVQGEEVYSIIRRRLFEPPDEAKMRATVDAYVQAYQQQKDDLPSKATAPDFRAKMERAYPFHPEVIDILYEKWSTFSTFQRTRGALRLLARVIEDLFDTRKAIDLILPGDINLGQPAIRHEFLRHIGSTYEGIIDSDIAGDNAKSRRLDQEHSTWDALAQRNAAAIFLHSFAADNSERGISLPYIKLDVARPDTMLPLVTDVLQKQQQELWYLNRRGEQEYYFSDVPNLNRMILDKKGQVQGGEVRQELKRRIQRELGSRLRAYLWPCSGDVVPDNQELKLVILDPAESHPRLHRWVEHRGQSYRAYKNTLIFASPDADRYARLQDTIKQYLALQDILEGIKAGEHAALEEKKGEVQRRLGEIEDDFPLKVRELYHTALLPVPGGGTLEDIDFGQPAVGRENLDSWFRTRLASRMHSKILSTPPSSNLIRAKFLANGDTISLQAVVEQFYKNPALPALDDPSRIAEAIAHGVKEGAFGIAHRTEGEVEPKTVRIDQAIATTQVNLQEEGWVLVTREKARALLSRIAPEPDSSGPGGDGEPAQGTQAPSSGHQPLAGRGDGTASSGQPAPSAASPVAETVQRVIIRASGIPSSRLHDLHRGVIKPLTGEAGEFDFTLELDVASDDGISKRIIEKTVIETLRQLEATVERQEME